MVEDCPHAMSASNIILVGFMGTGKSAVGKRLAEKLHRPFVDMDALIESRVGKSITRIFEEDGEPHFRSLETSIIKEISQQQEQVIAAGGGVVLNPENIRDFDRSGLVVCLSASPDEILRRVMGSSHRPLLEQKDRSTRIRSLLKKRQSFYDAIPCQVDTTDLAMDQVVSRILILFEQFVSSCISHAD